MAQSYYKIKYGRDFTPGQGLPFVSTALDSVRAYQFEVRFIGLPNSVTNQQDLTLAAKRVTGLEMTVEDIAVSRVNDRLYYPGKPSPGEVQVTFDNLYMRETSSDLWRYFKSIYDPVTGEMTPQSPPGVLGGTSFKVAKMEIIMLDNTSTPHSTIELYGVYPKKWAASELNYETNAFHTLEVNFRYDFMDSYNYSNPS